MTTNEIVGRLRDGGLDASSTNRSAAVYVAEAREGRSEAGWFAYRIICNSEETERRARDILSRYYDIEASGDVWRLKSKNRIPLMAIKRGAAPSTNGYMYLEAAQANSTVSMVSTLETAPNLEYSTDGVTWQTLEYTESEIKGTPAWISDNITLVSVGDKVWFRGDNPAGLGNLETARFSAFNLTGSVDAKGNVMSLIDKSGNATEVPAGGFFMLFSGAITQSNLRSAQIMDKITSIGNGGCNMMFSSSAISEPPRMGNLEIIGITGVGYMFEQCANMESAANMPAITSLAERACEYMYDGCTFAMSDDGETLNFAFPNPPVTAGETTYATAHDVATWMGNTNGF